MKCCGSGFGGTEVVVKEFWNASQKRPVFSSPCVDLSGDCAGTPTRAERGPPLPTFAHCRNLEQAKCSFILPSNYHVD